MAIVEINAYITTEPLAYVLETLGVESVCGMYRFKIYSAVNTTLPKVTGLNLY